MASVISIGKLGGGPGAERYYTDAVARDQEDYYSGEGEADGEWLGTGAGHAGLTGIVDADDFSNLLRGTAPSGTRLRREPDARSVIGFDLTFSAPKSVSVLYGIGDSRLARLTREAHDEAVKQALGYLERSACFARRGHGGSQRVRGDGLTVAAFRHRSSRAGDPQLHTHAIVANLTRAGGRWSTLDGRAIYAHARTAGFLYQAALRDELTRALGVEWGPVHRGVAEIQGIDPEVLRHFSRRREEIRQRMEARGERSARAAEVAALETRRRKDYGVPVNRLREEWRARAEEHGFGRSELADVVGRVDRNRRVPATTPDASFLSSHDGPTREASTFDRRTVLREWAEAHPVGAPVRQLEVLADKWLASPAAVKVDRGENVTVGPQYSTPEMLVVERDLMAQAEALRSAGAGLARDENVQAALTARPQLADEQADVVRGLTRSGHGIDVVRAAAGTGKTFALEAARDAWESSGYRVYGCALSARAAVELETQAGIDSTTIARLKMDLDRGYGLTARNVLVVDEAGMVGSRTLAELADHAESAGAKLVLVGDDRQLPEIDAGGAFRGIADRIGAFELHETRRQSHTWDRDALAALRVGGIDEWAARYRESGRILARACARETRDKLVTDWWLAARQDGVDAVMIAHRRSDVADLNERARALMAGDGRLGEDEVKTPARSFATGDRVLARHNDRRAGVVNGARGEILAVDLEQRSVTVSLQTGQTVVVDSGYLDAGHLDHGYAVTAHAAQGATVDRAFVLGSDDLYREWGYTALTRHREEARFYLVSPGSTERALPGLEPTPDPILEDLGEMLGESRQKSLAIDVLEEARLAWPVGNPSSPDKERRVAKEVAAAEAASEASRRLEQLHAERARVSPFARRARAELDRDISLQAAAEQHWLETAERIAASRGTAAAMRHAARLAPTDDRQADVLRSLVAHGRHSDPLGEERPVGLLGREEWATDAVHAALDAIEGREFAPAPVELDVAVDLPDLDFGP